MAKGVLDMYMFLYGELKKNGALNWRPKMAAGVMDDQYFELIESDVILPGFKLVISQARLDNSEARCCGMIPSCDNSTAVKGEVWEVSDKIKEQVIDYIEGVPSLYVPRIGLHSKYNTLHFYEPVLEDNGWLNEDGELSVKDTKIKIETDKAGTKIYSWEV